GLGDVEGARNQLHEIINLNPKARNAYFELVNIESIQGNGDKALEALNSYLKIAPGDIQALYMTAAMLLNNGDIDEADVIADRMVAEHPTHPSGKQIKGLVYFARGNYEQAIVELAQQIKISGDIIGHHFIGQAYYHTQQLELAINHFQKTLDLNPNHVQSRLLIAHTLLSQQRFDECINEIAKLRKIDKNNANAFYVLGSAYMGKGNYDRAIEALDQAIKINPDMVRAQVKKGLFTLATGNYQNAEAEFSKAISAAPEVTDNRLLLANLQLKQKKFSEALETLKAGLKKTDEDALLYNYIAVAYFGLGQDDQAIQSLKQSKNLKPEFLAPYFNLARYFVSKNEFPKAFDEYQALLSVTPQNVKALLELAALSLLEGKKDAAEDYYRKAALTGDVDALLAFSAFNQQQGKLTEAMTTVDQAYKKNPKDPRVLGQRGALSMALKQFDKMEHSFLALEEVARGRGLALLTGFYLSDNQQDKALELAQKQIENNPDSSDGYNLRASIFSRLGQTENAEEILLRGIQAVSQRQNSLQVNLTNLYISTGQLEKALAQLELLNQKAPQFPAVLLAWGNYFNVKGDRNQATRYFEATLDEQPDHTEAQNNLAYIYSNDPEKLDEALSLAMQSYRANPGNPSIMDTLGYILLKKGYTDKAVTLLERAVALLPQHDEVKLHLAQAYLAQAEREKAQELLQGIIDSASPALAKEAKRLLAAQ
ncbi:MAG: tetratricopeptide repeat protein, partial [Desulfuromonadales bacterium]|nr:tetratricopeptide repeat protein [Desulfuromonadales bacterium]